MRSLLLRATSLDKGLVKRNESERAHVYTATAPEEATQKQLVRDLVDRAFGGSASRRTRGRRRVTRTLGWTV